MDSLLATHVGKRAKERSETDDWSGLRSGYTRFYIDEELMYIQCNGGPLFGVPWTSVVRDGATPNHLCDAIKARQRLN